MIHLTRINGEEVVLNAGLIEFIEATPDTMISLTTGRKVLVKESVTEVVDRSMAYEALIGDAGRFGRRQHISMCPKDEDDTEDSE